MNPWQNESTMVLIQEKTRTKESPPEKAAGKEAILLNSTVF